MRISQWVGNGFWDEYSNKQEADDVDQHEMMIDCGKHGNDTKIGCKVATSGLGHQMLVVCHSDVDSINLIVTGRQIKILLIQKLVLQSQMCKFRWPRHYTLQSFIISIIITLAKTRSLKATILARGLGLRGFVRSSTVRHKPFRR